MLANSAMNSAAIRAGKSLSSPPVAGCAYAALATIVRAAPAFLADTFRWYCCGRELSHHRSADGQTHCPSDTLPDDRRLHSATHHRSDNIAPLCSR